MRSKPMILAALLLATQARPQPPCSKTQEEDPKMSGSSS
jgi:hypothetical protein